jgi:hypothetical protein
METEHENRWSFRLHPDANAIEAVAYPILKSYLGAGWSVRDLVALGISKLSPHPPTPLTHDDMETIADSLAETVADHIDVAVARIIAALDERCER